MSCKALRKSVRFDQNEVFVIESNKNEMLWYSDEDIEAIRKYSKEMSLLIRRRSKVEGRCCVNELCKKIFAKNNNIDGDDQECNDDDDGTTTISSSSSSHSCLVQDLASWCKHEDGRRGLERFASKEYNLRRRRNINHHRSSILMEQERQKKMRSSLLNKEEENTEWKIAKISQELSKGFLMFANCIAKADEVEARSILSTLQLPVTTGVVGSKDKNIIEQHQKKQQQKQQQQRKEFRTKLAKIPSCPTILTRRLLLDSKHQSFSLSMAKISIVNAAA